MKVNGSKSIIMRGNTAMETQYYLMLRDSSSYILDVDLFQDANHVGLFVPSCLSSLQREIRPLLHLSCR